MPPALERRRGASRAGTAPVPTGFTERYFGDERRALAWPAQLYSGVCLPLILVVYDQPLIQRLLAAVLRDTRFRTVQATWGKKGLAIASKP